MHDYEDFHRQVRNRMSDHAERFKRLQRWAVIFGIAQIAGVIAVLGFAGWVCVKLMQHFGVI